MTSKLTAYIGKKTVRHETNMTYFEALAFAWRFYKKE